MVWDFTISCLDSHWIPISSLCLHYLLLQSTLYIAVKIIFLKYKYLDPVSSLCTCCFLAVHHQVIWGDLPHYGLCWKLSQGTHTWSVGCTCSGPGVQSPGHRVMRDRYYVLWLRLWQPHPVSVGSQGTMPAGHPAPSEAGGAAAVSAAVTTDCSQAWFWCHWDCSSGFRAFVPSFIQPASPAFLAVL